MYCHLFMVYSVYPGPRPVDKEEGYSVNPPPEKIILSLRCAVVVPFCRLEYHIIEIL